jgi:hypothetical protein
VYKGIAIITLLFPYLRVSLYGYLFIKKASKAICYWLIPVIPAAQERGRDQEDCSSKST